MKTLYLSMSICAVLWLGACANTFEGAGRDIENMGEWMQDTF